MGTVTSRLVLVPLGIALLVLLLLTLWLVARQESLVFFPDAHVRLSPAMPCSMGGGSAAAAGRRSCSSTATRATPATAWIASSSS